MKIKAIKCSTLMLLLPLLVFAGERERVEKRINREFIIQSNGRVELLNKYGNMDVAIGSGNKVSIDVVISVTSSSEKKAKEALDKITVDFEEGNNRVSATTEIESNTRWMNFFSPGKVDIDIHYQVRVPEDVFLDLVNKYGNIYVETTNRDIDIDLAYGDLRLGDINGKLNLKMAYSNGSISQIGDGSLELSYSDLEMEDANDLNMDIKYTDVKSGTFQKLRLHSAYSDLHSISIGQIDYTGKYDDIALEYVNTINATSGYTGIVLEELTGPGSFDMRYGDLKIQNIHRGFQKLNINTSYTGVDLEFKPEASFSMEAHLTYCKIKYDKLNVSLSSNEGSKFKTFKGSRGSGGGVIVARMDYGELKIE